MSTRQFNVYIYSNDNATYIKTIAPNVLKALPTFTDKLNGGQGELVLDLNLPFDDFDEGNSINFMNFVELWSVDQNNPLGRRIYKGYISRYEPYIDGMQEGVKLTCLGLASLLTESYYGTSPSYDITQTGVDPEAIAKAIIDDFNGAYGGSLISYAGTTSTVGTNVTLEYAQRTWFDALNDTIALAGDGWWWHVDQNGQFYFQPKPILATHTLTIGLDIDKLSGIKDSESVENNVIVQWSGGPTAYDDATSQTTYGTGNPAKGRHTKFLSGSVVGGATITDSGTAAQTGNTALNDNKDAKVSPSVTVNLNNDIDSFKAGDCVQFSNFKLASSFFGSNVLQIVGLTYNGNSIDLSLEQHQGNFSISLSQFVRGT